MRTNTITMVFIIRRITINHNRLIIKRQRIIEPETRINLVPNPILQHSHLQFKIFHSTINSLQFQTNLQISNQYNFHSLQNYNHWHKCIPYAIHKFKIIQVKFSIQTLIQIHIIKPALTCYHSKPNIAITLHISMIL